MKNTKYDLTIGESLKNLREHKHITQKQLSEITGLSQQHISKIERNEIKPNIDTFLKIMNAFDIQIL